MDRAVIDWNAHRPDWSDPAGMSEERLRAEMPVYVNSFNQLGYLNDILGWFERHGFGNVSVVDQVSDYPPLLEFYGELEAAGRVRLIRLGTNIGPRAIVADITAGSGGAYVFTDPDLALPDPPTADFLSRLVRISARHRCKKVGLALALPEPEESAHVRFEHAGVGTFTVQAWEERFWRYPVEPDLYRANVDTTFFLWNPAAKPDLRRFGHGLRMKVRPTRLRRLVPLPRIMDLRKAGVGFIARHRPWYADDTMPEDEARHYAERAKAWTSWVR